MFNWVKLETRKIKNTRDTDIYIRDGYGNEHIIYPGQKKTIAIIGRINNDRK